MSQATPSLAVPGVVHVGNAESPEGAVVTAGPSAGWLVPAGIREWSQEISVILRSDLTDALREQLGVTLPENRIAKGRHPHAHRAAEAMRVVGVTGEVAPKLVEKGVRVHTVGYDRVTGGFVYLVEGGKEPPVNIHGDLLEMISPALEGGSSNEDIERHLDGFIDRLLRHASKGALDELSVELANALPRLSTDARGLAGVDLDAFEAEAGANAERAKKHEDGAKKLAEAIEKANGGSALDVPLFGKATGAEQPAMAVMLGGDAIVLPARTRWLVKGPIQEVKAAAPAPVVKPVESKPVESKPVESKPVAAKPAPTPTPAPASAKPAVAARPAPTPSPAPASAKPVVAAKPAPAVTTPVSGTPKVPTPSPKVPVVAKKPEPVVAAPPPPVVEVKPEPVVAAPPPVVEVKPEPVAPPPPPVVEVKPEVKPEPAPAPKVEEKKPEPVVEAKPEPKPEPKPAPKAEEQPEQKGGKKGKGKGKGKSDDKPEAKAAEPAPAAKAEEKKPEPAAAKVAKVEEPAEQLAAPEAPKSNMMVFVVIGLLVAAALAFFFLKK